MLDNLLQFSHDINIPEDYLRKKANTYFEDANSTPIPDVEATFSKKQEDYKDLVDMLKDEMKMCPFENIILKLKEKTSVDGIKRNLELTGQIPEKKNKDELDSFKNDFFSNVVNTNSFFDLDDCKSYKIEDTQGKGQKFESPNLYDINGDETTIGINDIDSIIFIYDKNEDFEEFIKKCNSLNLNVICVCKTPDFFGRKKYLIEQGFLNQFPHYFLRDEEDNAFNKLKCPRIIVVNSKGVVYENKTLNGLKNVDLQNEVLYAPEQNEIDEVTNLNAWFSNGDNKTKSYFVKKINRDLEQKGLNQVNFNIDSETLFDKEGVLSTKVKPQFNGICPKSKKNILENLIKNFTKDSKLEQVENKVEYI
jgi:hypothetical protein